MATKAIFEKKNVLVTGGAGFIGSHLCDELVKTSKVICVDNFISGSEQNIDHLLQNPDFEFIKHDINESFELESLKELDKFRVEFQGVQEIYHLAAPTAPKDFEQTRLASALTHSVGIRNVLELAVKYKAKFLLASSSVVYGARSAARTYFEEDDIGLIDHLSPRAAYDEGKRFAETLTHTYAITQGIDAKIVRIFRTYGSRMQLGVGHMLPDFVLSAIEQKELVVHGDKSFSTSLCHVSDIVQGLMKVMKSGEPGPINLGSATEYKIVDVARKVIELTKSSSKIVFKKPLMFMTPLGLPDIRLAKERLGWFPVVLLDEGLTGAIDYFRAHKSVVKPGEKRIVL